MAGALGPPRAPADARRSVCSNRAATQVNILKFCENSLMRNAAVCRNFAIYRNVRNNVALLLQGGGRWFDRAAPTQEKLRFEGKTASERKGSRRNGSLS